MNTTIDPEATLGELVTGNPRLAAELERRSLDYCCGGQRTLAEACERAGLDVETVSAELGAVAAPESPPEWADLGPAELVDHLEAVHHAYLHGELPRLVALAEKVASVHGERHPELADVSRAVVALRADLEPHLAKEEQVLFPMIRELAAAEAAPAFHCGSLGNPISVMLRDHDVTGELLERLRDLTGGYAVPADACGSYRALYEGLEAVEADTHLHVHKENNVLFPQVLALEESKAA